MLKCIKPVQCTTSQNGNRNVCFFNLGRICVDALHPSQQFFNHVGMFACLSGLNQYKIAQGHNTVPLESLKLVTGFIQASLSKFKDFSRTSKRLSYSFQGQAYEKYRIKSQNVYFRNARLR